jgi:hydrogenase-4 component B
VSTALLPELLTAVVLLPAALAALWPVPALRGTLIRLAPWAAAPALLLALLALLGEDAPLSVELPTAATGLAFALDATGAAFLFLTALLWLMAGIFARSYHARDGERNRFFGFFALTMAGNLGLTVAAEALTFYVFFATMTFAAYGLVVHGRSREALRAGRVYIILALVGEVLLLAGLMILGSGAGGLGAPGLGFGAELAETWSGMEAGFLGGRALVASLLVAGFGVKAGLVPLHVWLPLAHPVAPTAASALLSGAMIKAGLLGWLRFLPTHLPLPEVGGVLMVVGIVTAFYGILAGLAQTDPKTVLAYSSVSQMGNMALGTGILLLLPGAAPVALMAVVLYAVHHGVAKGALFLGVGVGDRAPALRTPLLATTLLPALALAGAPFTSGVLAKELLKEGLAEVGGEWYAILDPLLLLAAGGTALLMVRFAVVWAERMWVARMEGTQGAPDGPPRLPWGLVLPWGALILVGALAPLWLPALETTPGALSIPGWFQGLPSALLPVVVGTALGLAIISSPRIAGRLEGLRIPPGDLLIPVARLSRLLRIPHRRKALSGHLGRMARALPSLSSPGARLTRSLERGARLDLQWVRGFSLGFLLLGLAVLLTIVSLV